MAPITIPPDDPGDHGKDDGVVTVAGSVEITNDVGSPIPVSGTIDIGTIPEVEIKNDAGSPVPVSGSVTAIAQPGVDIGDVTVNNAAGAAAVNIQDGGNSITVDGPLTDAQLRASTVGVDVHTESYGGLLHGQNSDIDSGANEQIVVASNVATKGVLVKALAANTGTIYVGGSGVSTSNGVPLAAGESITIPVANANLVYAIASVDNQALAWMAS